ncbi:hypothetical protein EJ08DRAFT_454034 [Tothia fuscella]|uniref:Uncharacterized protein n=1 Tax=Tothia fuscella TaxID=1048955 RepID=A0A9P4TV23_9PEZI|nr:hypothetical protein EJ08DRAFT_454034 [Tothia fuscella]
MSTFSYEVLPQEFFHDLFPWHCYGGLFDTEVGQFHRHSEGESSSRNIVLPSACVPILWSRRESLTRMTRRLTYDAWMLPRYYERFNHGYWDNDCAVWKEWRMDDELLPVMEIINIGLIFPPRELQRYCDRYEELRGYFEEPVEWEDQEEHEWH